MKTTKKPLDCARVRELLYEYADGTLDSKLMGAVLAHIEACEDCRRELDETVNMLDALKSCAEEPPASLYEGVMARVGQTEQEPAVIRGAGRRFIPIGSIAAACAVVMMLVVGRHVIFNSRIDGASEDIVNDTAVGSLTALIADENSDLIATNTASDANAHGLYSADAEPTVEVTTSGVSVSAPRYGVTDVTAAPSAPSSTPLKDKSKSAANVDKVFSAAYKKENAVIVCLESALDGDKDNGEKLVLADVTVYRFTDSKDAVKRYYSYIEALSDEGVYFRSAMPSEFTACEIYLVAETES